MTNGAANLLLKSAIGLFKYGNGAIKKEAFSASSQHTQRYAVLAGIQVNYEFRRGQRRTIGFSVGAQGLVVSAPRWVALREVEQALQEKSNWIIKKLQEAQQRQAQLEAGRMEWRHGARLDFLGSAVTLVLNVTLNAAVPPLEKGGIESLAASADAVINATTKDICASSPNPASAVNIADSQSPLAPLFPRGELGSSSSRLDLKRSASVQLSTQDMLCLNLPHSASAEQIKNAVQAWLMEQARDFFVQRLTHFALQLGVQWKKLSLSSAATRWGSASADGAIRLNWRLVHCKPELIDYVVVHELSHLRVMNHSPRFWATVASVLPDYARLRRELKNQTIPIF